jgi:hypothetical protein
VGGVQPTGDKSSQAIVAAIDAIGTVIDRLTAPPAIKRDVSGGIVGVQ